MNGQKLKFMPADPSNAPENRRMRNTEKSNMGSTWWRCTAAKTITLTMATTRLAMAEPLEKPVPAPCVMNQERPNTASDSEIMPNTSSLRRCGSTDSSTPTITSANASTAIGACTRNTHSQLDNATIAAPIIGPNPKPMPNTIPQALKALPRAAPNWNR